MSMSSDDEVSPSSSQSTPADEVAKPRGQPRDDVGPNTGDEEKSGAGGIEIGPADAGAASTSKAFRLRMNKKKGMIQSQMRKSGGKGNELTHLIPGYTAPMWLEAKSLRGITGKSLAELRKRATREDSTTNSPPISILSRRNETAFDPAVAAKKVKTPSSIAIQKSTGRGRKIPTSFSSSFRRGPRKQHDNTAGSKWFGMTPTPMTDQLKTDLSIIRNRNYLDPKKFYKSADSFDGKVLQVGTVIEGSAEFYSSRLAKRDRRQNLTEEIMADANVSNYAKRKYRDIQAEKARPQRNNGKRGRKRR